MSKKNTVRTKMIYPNDKALLSAWKEVFITQKVFQVEEYDKNMAIIQKVVVITV